MVNQSGQNLIITRGDLAKIAGIFTVVSAIMGSPIVGMAWRAVNEFSDLKNSVNNTSLSVVEVKSGFRDLTTQTTANREAIIRQEQALRDHDFRIGHIENSVDRIRKAN